LQQAPILLPGGNYGDHNASYDHSNNRERSPPSEVVL